MALTLRRFRKKLNGFLACPTCKAEFHRDELKQQGREGKRRHGDCPNCGLMAWVPRR